MDLKFRVAARIAQAGARSVRGGRRPGQIVELFHDRRRQGPARNRRDRHLGFRTTFRARSRSRSSRSSRTRRSSSNGRLPKAKRQTFRTPTQTIADAGYKTKVTMTFTPLDGDTRTLVEISGGRLAREPRARSRRATAIARAGRRCSPRSRPGSSTASTCARACTSRTLMSALGGKRTFDLSLAHRATKCYVIHIAGRSTAIR